MDPWLECPAFWLDVHNSLCVAMRDALVPLVSPRYIVGVEARTTVLGRAQYLAKRQEPLHSRTSLIEIDLMRGGTPLPARTPVPASDYRILIDRGDRRPKDVLYRFSYKVPIPTIPIPLLPGEAEPRLDLTAVLHGQIERARYYQRIDYSQPPVPPLPPEDVAWAAAILARTSEPQT